MSGSAYDHVPIKAKVPPSDGRSADWRLMRRTKEALTRQVGGKPSAVVAMQIDQACWLTLFIQRLNERALINGGAHTDEDTHTYLAYSAIRLCVLSRLGLGDIPDADDLADPANEVVAA